MFLVSLLSATAVLAGKPRVVLVEDPDASVSVQRAVRRLQAEFVAAGFEVVLEGPPRGQLLDALTTMTRSEGALAGVWITERPTTRARIWLVDRATGKVVVRELKAPADAGEFLAIRTIELLEASLLELDSVPPEVEYTTPEDVDALRQVVGGTEDPGELAPAKSPTARWAAPRGSLGVTYGPRVGAFPVHGALALGGSASFTRERILFLGGELSASLPVATIEFGEGQARVREFEGLALVGIEGLPCCGPTRTMSAAGRVRPRLALGAGVVLVTARENIEDRSDQTVIARLVVQPGVNIGLTRSLRLELDSNIGFRVPEIRVLEQAGSVSRVVSIDLRVGLRWTWRGAG